MKTDKEFKAALRKGLKAVSGDTKPQYTPTPWKVLYGNGTHTATINATSNNKRIAAIDHDGVNELDEANANAQIIVDAVNSYDALKKKAELSEELIYALKELYESCDPKDVTPNKIILGIDLGDYVGSKGIPSDKAIHRAMNILKKAQEL